MGLCFLVCVSALSRSHVNNHSSGARKSGANTKGSSGWGGGAEKLASLTGEPPTSEHVQQSLRNTLFSLLEQKSVQC